MRVDTGLQDGVAALRQNGQLIDLTLKVDDQEFKVHKLVLASVSDYFHAMLCGSLKERNSDVVELKNFSAEQVSRLLDFIYTGDSNIIASDPKEMLECGVYFQIPKMIQECTQTLIKSLCVGSCQDLLATFLKFPVDDTAKKIRDFIKANMRKVIDHYKPHEIPIEIIQIALEKWKKNEWELFNYLNTWIAVDPENRKKYMDDLMSQVRFKLMTPREILAVQETEVYAECDGSWKDLVDKAATYHQLPIHQKVLDKSIQNRVRFAKSVFLMPTSEYWNSMSSTFVLCKGDQGLDSWKKYKPAKPPNGSDQLPHVIEVNNFLITHTDDQLWQVFDPRTLTWYEIANMSMPRDRFAAVYHSKHLYVLGGLGEDVSQDEYSNRFLDRVEQYSFESGTWSYTEKLPVPVLDLRACAFQDAIYVSGGRVSREPARSARMDCLDLASREWKSKAPLLRGMTDHKMCVMKIKMKDVIVVINRDLKMDFYDADTDQWTQCNFNVPDTSSLFIEDRPIQRMWLKSNGLLFVTRNTIFLLNVDAAVSDDQSDSEGERPDYSLCVRWTIPEGSDTYNVVESRMHDFPLRGLPFRENVICSMLAFPARPVTK